MKPSSSACRPCAATPAGTLSFTPRAWAFAFWGGDFYVFLMRDIDNSTSVYKVKGNTGKVTASAATASPYTGISAGGRNPQREKRSEKRRAASTE